MGYTFGAMPWNQVTPMEEKHRFVSLAATGKFSVTELCTEFKVSRKTGHKWLHRYQAEGTAGLRDRSRRPHGCAHHTAEPIERLIVQERRRHRTWGRRSCTDFCAGIIGSSDHLRSAPSLGCCAATG